MNTEKLTGIACAVDAMLREAAYLSDPLTAEENTRFNHDLTEYMNGRSDVDPFIWRDEIIARRTAKADPES